MSDNKRTLVKLDLVTISKLMTLLANIAEHTTREQFTILRDVNNVFHLTRDNLKLEVYTSRRESDNALQIDQIKVIDDNYLCELKPADILLLNAEPYGSGNYDDVLQDIAQWLDRNIHTTNNPLAEKIRKIPI